VCVGIINSKTFSEIILEKLFLRSEKIIEKVLWWVKTVFSQRVSENNYFRKKLEISILETFYLYLSKWLNYNNKK
jgi:hypothetical protein